jgi:CxxC motif-containing protein (DUF1111 family)
MKTNWVAAGVMVCVACSAVLAGSRKHPSRVTISAAEYDGRELFTKTWEPGVPSASGGDGLGPCYNETSCVACHNLGGTGGAGESKHDVELLTAFAGPSSADGRVQNFLGELEEFHPGFRYHTTIVLHRHATDPAQDEQLARNRKYASVQTRDEVVPLLSSKRNTPALFGVGLIDAVPDEVLRDAEDRHFAAFPEIHGKLSRLPDGRLGRFGWKGQIASLRAFVLAACANELGLEVPGHHQASLTSWSDFDPSRLSLDLDQDQCDHLVEFLRKLPPPQARPVRDTALPPWGYLVFEQVGCATCHTRKLGSVDGIYSDLLLHNLGSSDSDSGSYYGAPSSRDLIVDRSGAKDEARSAGRPGPSDWRTPPLWGVADSAPYMHDGRAGTLDDAIRLHGGEAEATSRRYAKLAATDRRALVGFLRSLTVATPHRRQAGTGAKQPAGTQKNRAA